MNDRPARANKASLLNPVSHSQPFEQGQDAGCQRFPNMGPGKYVALYQQYFVPERGEPPGNGRAGWSSA
jgi:hypothetical protein